MFDGLSSKLTGILDRLRKRGVLSDSDVDEALREVRVALLEADVALPVATDFLARVRVRALGQDVLRSVTPGQMVVKIVHDALVETLGGPGEVALRTGTNPPAAILMVGLQGSGKTTTTAKLALRLEKRERRKILMASLDVTRPAAQQQLAQLGVQTGIRTLTPVLGERPVAIAKRALETARREAFDVVILDTAGRLALDEDMMAEAEAVRDAARPIETLLVADAMTGQDAINVAGAFHRRVGLTGIVLTRVDGDTRGGAALSMRATTGCPIKLIGVGEKLDALEPFDAQRIAGSILGMGDIVGLVERASETMAKEDAEKLAAKMMKGQFSLQDMADQFRQLRKMGDIQGLLGMLPGIGKIKNQLAAANVNDRTLARQEAIILSMTRRERRDPKVLNASRRKRIAAGSGATVQDVNRLIKQFEQAAQMMKQAAKMGGRGLMGGRLPPGFGPPPFGR
ncbi:MAG: signal recognition particle protein [Rhodospirillales bacterium]|nr:signal recognition particle protein [Rhodospirillales bacterium]MSP80133.1 signal recognition particle protein [Rhodospirillales bacterium]